MQWIVATNLDATSDKNENGIGVFRGLHVGRLDRVRDLTNRLKLLNNGFGALEGCTFKGHHGFSILNRYKSKKIDEIESEYKQGMHEYWVCVCERERERC
jgi:hypothetical protein